MPPFSGSDYFCYKGFHAMILLGLCDYRYRFIVVDFGAKGRASDGGVFAHSKLGRMLKANQLDIPPPQFVPNGPLLPYFLLGDEAFGLSEYMMTPYPGRSLGMLTYSQRIFNYRQSRGRRIIENVFGMFVATWRIFKTEIDAQVELIEQLVMSAACLHNFRLIMNDERSNQYTPRHFFDHEVNGVNIPGTWRDEDVELCQIASQHGRHSSAKAVQFRNELADFFLTSGAVPWQHSQIDK
ncbi:uncharacterized protein LOC119079227 isoform X2 [Bradysia coprophila]|nr:uncharacterized protein LOC119079227 isoform X2 [Bradysia coprophila]